MRSDILKKIRLISKSGFLASSLLNIGAMNNNENINENNNINEENINRNRSNSFIKNKHIHNIDNKNANIIKRANSTNNFKIDIIINKLKKIDITEQEVENCKDDEIAKLDLLKTKNEIFIENILELLSYIYKDGMFNNNVYKLKPLFEIENAFLENYFNYDSLYDDVFYNYFVFKIINLFIKVNKKYFDLNKIIFNYKFNIEFSKNKGVSYTGAVTSVFFNHKIISFNNLIYGDLDLKKNKNNEEIKFFENITKQLKKKKVLKFYKNNKIFINNLFMANKTIIHEMNHLLDYIFYDFAQFFITLSNGNLIIDKDLDNLQPFFYSYLKDSEYNIRNIFKNKLFTELLKKYQIEDLINFNSGFFNFENFQDIKEYLSEYSVEEKKFYEFYAEILALYNCYKTHDDLKKLICLRNYYYNKLYSKLFNFIKNNGVEHIKKIDNGNIKIEYKKIDDSLNEGSIISNIFKKDFINFLNTEITNVEIKENNNIINEKNNVKPEINEININSKGIFTFYYNSFNNNFKKNIISLDFSNSKICLQYSLAICNEFENLENIIFGDTYFKNINRLDCLFENCKSLKYVDLSKFDTSNVISMGGMFKGCNNLKKIEGIENFITFSVYDMSEMFSGCELLEELTLNFNLDNLQNCEKMFYNCKKLKKLNLNIYSKNDLNYSENCSYMFKNCESLESLNIKDFTFNSNCSLIGMFENCFNLKEIILPENPNPVGDISCFFKNCIKLNNIKNLSEMQFVNNLKEAFYNCESLENLSLQNIDFTFSTSESRDCSNMFYNCKNLKKVKFLNDYFYDDVYYQNPYIISDNMFSGCNSDLELNCKTKNDKLSLIYNEAKENNFK